LKAFEIPRFLPRASDCYTHHRADEKDATTLKKTGHVRELPNLLIVGSKYTSFGDSFGDSMVLRHSNLSPDEDRQHRAAIAIQTVAIKRIVGRGFELKRQAVVDRLKLESRMQEDLRLMLFCAIQFALLIAVCIAESPAPLRLGLLRTYKDVFFLDGDSLANIKTLDSLNDYLSTVSERARMLQPLSDYYFRDPEGAVHVFQGMQAFTKPAVLNLEDLKPRFDTPEWTLTAWVQFVNRDAEGTSGGYILRKPLGQSPEVHHLSCWAWYMGYPRDKVGNTRLLSSIYIYIGVCVSSSYMN
jgi:hypothetical protein